MKIKRYFLSLRCKYIFLVVTTLVFAISCATIPKESVVLSQEIGKGIAESQRAYIGLLNRYFDQKKELIDQAIMEKYLPGFILDIREKLKAASENPDLLDSTKVADIIKAVIQKRDEMQADLENARILLLEQIEADHKFLLQANADLTGLIKSAVDVKKATSLLTETLAKPIIPNFDFLEFEKFLGEYLNKVGAAAAEVREISEKMKSLIKKGGK